MLTYFYSVVTGVYKGSPRGAPPALLRSYDSRKEPPPEFDCKIWQAGRATCSVGLAFKPVQIGQSVFHDDGNGHFNPSPEALDEAVINEWPGREIGCFVSVGTGRRPKGTDSEKEQWYEGFLGEFAEARRRLIAKIEGCEKIHEFMVRDHLNKRNVNVENYYRLNVEIGVGEFGMNEWKRLGEISTGTRRYMGRTEEQKMVQGISTKLAKIHKAKIRWERALRGVPEITHSDSHHDDRPFAVELPGDLPSQAMVPPRSPGSRQSFDSGQDSIHMGSPRMSSSRASHDFADSHNSHMSGPSPSPGIADQRPPPPPKDDAENKRNSDTDKLLVTAPTPSQYRTASGADKIAIMSPDEHPKPPPPSESAMPPQRIEPPPLPPKTPLPEHQQGLRRPQHNPAPPYPMDDDAPPPVNMARKPDYRR